MRTCLHKYILFLYIFLINSLGFTTSITAGSSHSLFLDENGQAWATGNNNNGQLGLGDKIDRSAPTKINNLPTIISVTAGSEHSLFLDENGKVWATGFNNHGQLGLGDRTNRTVPEKINNLPTIFIERKIDTKSARNIVE
mgnify:CR=1 FL=1